jgi:hypothetical protein
MVEYLRRAKNLTDIRGTAVLTGATSMINAMEECLSPIIKNREEKRPQKISGEDFRILSLIHLGVSDIDLLAYLTSKDPESLIDQLKNLIICGWLDEEGSITETGLGLIERVLEGITVKEEGET